MSQNKLETIGARARRACEYFDNRSSVGLADLARMLDVKRVLEDRIFDGATSITPDGYTVYINPKRPVVRRRFSMAHELAHILIQPDLTGAERLKTGDSDERLLESLCNQVAATILMPARAVRRRLAALGRTPASVVAIAREFNVSKEAMARKIVSIAPNPYVIVCAKVSESTGRLAIEWAYASPRSIYRSRYIPRGKHVDSIPHFERAKAYPAPWRLDGYISLRVLGFGPRHRAVTSTFRTGQDPDPIVLSVIDLHHQLPLSIST